MFGLTPFERKGYDIFDAFNDFDKEFFNSDFFRRSHMTPAQMMKHEFCTDIQDQGDKYVLEAELPGFNKEDISIDISRDYLTISAKRETSEDKKDKNGKYIRRERTMGSFQRSFSIEGIDSESINAEYNDGVLKVILPKKEQIDQTRRLEIK